LAVVGWGGLKAFLSYPALIAFSLAAFVIDVRAQSWPSGNYM
jgi:hypothetical protein